MVDTGTAQVEVVCGAPNARTGMKGVFAPPGTTIPGTGVVLKKAKIRGVESCGMLCSEREMGLSDEHEGIIELDADAPVGAPFAEIMGLDDPLFDIAITPNRGDCLGVHGIARDLAAAGLGRLKTADIEPVASAFKSPIDVILDFSGDGPSPCPLFLGRYVRGVKNCESPRWLKERLTSIGLRPISALVDLTNFLTIDRNRPVHVFDASKVKGDIWLRLGQGGAAFDALNGKEYVLGDAMTAIGDESGVISLAGVMGGEPTGCTMETTDVFIEIALFDPVRTAATGRTFNLESDARYRFERGVDPAFAAPGLELMTRLVIELCGGEASDVVVAGASPAWRREIAFRPSRVKALGGVDFARTESLGILTDLGFACEEQDDERVAVRPPPWRGDILGEADLVEEVLRIAGFDRIPSVSLTPTAAERARPALTPTRRRLGAVRRSLTARGMFEAVTWSFVPRQHAALFGGGADELVLANPINAELDAMRPSILPNPDRGLPAQRGPRPRRRRALRDRPPSMAAPALRISAPTLTGVRAAEAVPRNWHGAERPVDPFDAKADALSALHAAGVSLASLQTRAEGPAWYHPGRGRHARARAQRAGPFRRAASRRARRARGRGADGGLRGDGGRAPQAQGEGHARQAAPRRLRLSGGRARLRLHPRQRGPRGGRRARRARNAEKALIKGVTVFDVYAGPGIEADKKSLAITVRLEARDRTLTDPEIDAAAAKIVANVAKITGGVLRG